MAIFKGAGVTIVTPMKENLEVNYDKLDEILRSRSRNRQIRSLSAERQVNLQRCRNRNILT